MEKIGAFKFVYKYQDLASNQIGDEGCAHLSRTDWKNLSTLDLGICANMQVKIKLVFKDCNI